MSCTVDGPGFDELEDSETICAPHVEQHVLAAL